MRVILERSCSHLDGAELKTAAKKMVFPEYVICGKVKTNSMDQGPSLS
jgi:hypothetical protein